MSKFDPKFPLAVFYDGSCRVCSAEMDHYRRLDRRSRLNFVDIHADHFDPATLGPSREDFMKELHVQDADGRFFKGVDGFAAIWSALPGRRYRVAAAFIALPLVHGLARAAYWTFARFRRFLPKAATDCGAGECTIKRHHSRRNG